MKSWKNRVADADGNTAAAVSKVAELKDALNTVFEKRNALDSKVGEVEAKSGLRLIRLNTFSVRQAHIDKLMRSINEQ